MAYVPTAAESYGTDASVIQLDSSHPGYVSVPDAKFLFTAEFHRAGPDLLLTGQDGERHLIPGYFAAAERPALTAPNGAKFFAGTDPFVSWIGGTGPIRASTTKRPT